MTLGIMIQYACGFYSSFVLSEDRLYEGLKSRMQNEGTRVIVGTKDINDQRIKHIYLGGHGH